MRFLLDVNVLIALVDGAHVNHDAAHAWFAEKDWAICPLVENAFVRILSNPAYPTVQATPALAIRYLRGVLEHPRRVSVADDVSLADPDVFEPDGIGTAAAVTDTYLLGLARRHGLRLATFDRRLGHGGVRGAGWGDIERIPA
jgi:hypothetical protein